MKVVHRLSITTPLPDKRLMPNNAPGTHTGIYAKRAKKNALKKAAHACALVAAQDAGLSLRGEGGTIRINHKPWKKVRVRWAWIGKTKNVFRIDYDNAIAAIKGALDGFTDAGVWEDDNGVDIGKPTFAVDKARPRLEFVIERDEG